MRAVSREEMLQIDHRLEREGITRDMLHDRGGKTTAEFVFETYLFAQGAVVVAGEGYNGHYAIATAKYLSEKIGVSVLLSGDEDNSSFEKEANSKLTHPVLRASALSTTEIEKMLSTADVIVDGLLGYNIVSDPKNTSATLIWLTNASRVPVLALDMPSGLDPDNGNIFQPTIIADSTLALGFPKLGLFQPNASRYVGKLFLGDIGVPDDLYAELFSSQNIFGGKAFIKIPEQVH